MAEPVSATGGAPRSWELTPARQNLLALFLLFLITIPMLTKIFTSDFGTHLAIGRHIWEHREISSPEFLNYTALGMTNYFHEWGFQFILYGVYSAGGAIGVSIFCWLIVCGIFFLIYRACVLRGAHPLMAVLAILAFSGFLRIRIQPRPEILTYLFISICLYIFSEYYYGTRKKLIYVFPVLMLFWGNIHGSYLIGLILWGVFFTDALARAAWNKALGWEKLKGWVGPQLVIGTLGLVFCGFSPDGYSMLLMPLRVLSRDKSGGSLQGTLMSISELTPVVGTGMYVYYKAAAVIAAITLLLGAFGRRVFLLDILLALMAFKGAWDSARAVSMLGLFLSPGISIQISGFLDRICGQLERVGVKTKGHEKSRSQRRRKPAEVEKGSKSQVESREGAVRPKSKWIYHLAFGGVAAALIGFGIIGHSFSFSQLEFGIGITEHKFSFRAAEFLRKNPIKGNMFNFFDIGGFLDWQLYGQAMTFIDGRAIRPDVFQDHQVVTGAMPGWKEKLRTYGVTYVVLKAMDSSGTILPLVPALSTDPEWNLVFSDGLFLIFVKNVPENQDMIRKFGIPKGYLLYHVIREAYHYLFLGVSPVVAYQTMARMYELMGDIPSSKWAWERAIEFVDDPVTKARMGGMTPRSRGRGN
jgi:hypothetical protein